MSPVQSGYLEERKALSSKHMEFSVGFQGLRKCLKQQSLRQQTEVEILVVRIMVSRDRILNKSA